MATSTSTSKRFRPAAAISALGLSLVLAGCISPVARPDGRYATPIGTAPVISNETPYSAALRCMGSTAARIGAPAPRIAVGNIRDYTGKQEPEGGPKITQGASLMAISALSKANVALIERFDTSVSELELKYANNKLITDDAEGTDYRLIHAGSILGSEYYLVGGITELNFNIRSGGLDGFFSDLDDEGMKANLTANLFVMNVGLDLRLVNSQTLEVADVISYQKQILGREIRAGVFDFLNGNIFDIGVGERAIEPIQLAVRSTIERAVLEMLVPIYGIDPRNCDASLENDPLGSASDFETDGTADARVRVADAETGADMAPVSESSDAELKVAAAPVAPVETAPVKADNTDGKPMQLAQLDTKARVQPAPLQEVTYVSAKNNDPYAYYDDADDAGFLRGGFRD